MIERTPPLHSNAQPGGRIVSCAMEKEKENGSLAELAGDHAFRLGLDGGGFLRYGALCRGLRQLKREKSAPKRQYNVRKIHSRAVQFRGQSHQPSSHLL